jgi:hypothetical protein
MPSHEGWKMMPPRTLMQRNTDLLLLDLRFSRRTTLALQSLNSSLQSCAESTCLADKFFQPLSIARCRSVVCVVK